VVEAAQEGSIIAHIQKHAADRGVLTAKLQAMKRALPTPATTAVSRTVEVLVPERVKPLPEDGNGGGKGKGDTNNKSGASGGVTILTDFAIIVIACGAGGENINAQLYFKVRNSRSY
jgi:hypothetical protein